MLSKIFGPRKRRTREHVIADQSVNHLERFIIDAGHTAQRLGSDYGYDLIVWAFDEQGYAEPGAIHFQFKAMEALRAGGLHALEVTTTTPNAVDVIREARKKYGSETLIGIGTVQSGWKA